MTGIKKINKVTYKEVMIIYGCTARGAGSRLEIIRKELNKGHYDLLTVIEFCRAEDMSLDDFDILYERACSHLPKQNQTTLF